MTNYIYARVSTAKQANKNQMLGVMDYMKQHNLEPGPIVEEVVTGKTHWRERNIAQLIDQAKEGDRIIVAEISRLGRTTEQVLELIRVCLEKKIEVHVTKMGLIIDTSIASTVMTTILSLCAEIERVLIQERVQESIDKRRAEGLPLGRPKGKATSLKLDNKAAEIDKLLQLNLNKRSIAKLIGCQPATLYTWLKTRRGWTPTETDKEE